VSRPSLPQGFDPTAASALAHGRPHEELAELRRAAPVTWVSQPRGSSGFDDEGYWAVTKHADVMAISRDTETWSSWENTAIVRYRTSITRPEIEMQRAVMLNMDPPYHTQIRGIVARGFTPRAIGALRGALAERAEKIVREARLKGNGEFVVDVASELPLQAISELLGVSQEDRGKIFDWSNKMVYDNPDEPDVPLIAAMEVLAYATQMAEERQVSPRDDIASKLVAA
jgi:cholest-4-en-3-one 26-monooxygenase